jgi:2-dehydropantoate 2-reductase
MANGSAFKSYAILGSGKVARCFQFYLRHLNLNFTAWSRNGDPEFNFGANDLLPSRDKGARLAATVQNASHILLAVSDPALNEVAAMLPLGRTLVHFSGSAKVAGVASAHPLMTFGSTQLSADWCREIPFVIDEGFDFSKILPGLPNPSFSIRPSQRQLYHALCALAGNSTFLLWQKIAEEFREDLNLPAEILAPFLHQVVTNALRPEARGLATGPVARGDWAAVTAHLESLQSNPSLAAAYRGFLNQSAYAGIKVPETLL